LEASAQPLPKNSLTLAEIEKVLRLVLDEQGALNEVVPLGDKWVGGTMILQPANQSLKPKDIPIETFFTRL
jgi:hypothetical protein